MDPNASATTHAAQPPPQPRRLPETFRDTTLWGSMSLAKSLEKERPRNQTDGHFPAYREYDVKMFERQKKWLSAAPNAPPPGVPAKELSDDERDTKIEENEDALVANLQNADEPEINQSRTNRIQQFLHERKQRHDDAYKSFCDYLVNVSEDARVNVENAIILFKDKIKLSDEGIAAELELLDDSNIAELNSIGFDQLWERVASHTPVRLAHIQSLEGDLERAEVRRCKLMEKGTKDAAVQLVNIGYHLDDDVERLLQADAHTANMSVIANRIAYAQLVASLRIEEARREQKQRRYWESRRSSWRQLRHLRAISKFKEAVSQDDFTFPSSWKNILSDMKMKQESFMEKVRDKIHSLQGIKPPYYNGRFAAQWCDGLNELARQEAKAVQSCVISLEHEHDLILRKCETLLAEVKEELISYGVMTPEETEQMIQEELRPMSKNVMDNSSTFVANIRAYLNQQSTKFVSMIEGLKKYVNETSALYDMHEENLKTCRANNQSSLDNLKSSFDETNNKSEEEFNSLTDTIRTGPSPAIIDEYLQKALAVLNNMEDGFRQYQEKTVVVKQELIPSLQQQYDGYERNLCQYFRLIKGPQIPSSERAESPDTDGSRSITGGSRQPRVRKKDSNAEGRTSRSPSQTRAVTPERDRHGSVSRSPSQHDSLWRGQWTEETTGFTSARGFRYAFMSSEPEPKPEPPPVVEEAPKPEEKAQAQKKEKPGKEVKDAKENKDAKDGKDAKKSEKELKVEKREVKSTPEPPPLPEEKPEAPLVVADLSTPTDPNGIELLIGYSLPSDDMTQSKRYIRTSLINDYEAMSISVVDATREKVKLFIDTSTKSLNDQLRQHRPRAGQLELDVHNIRLGELTSNRQKFERHTQSIVQLSDRQQKEFDELFEKAEKYFVEFTNNMKQQSAHLTNVDNTNSLQVLERATAKIHFTFVEGMRERTNAMKKRAEEMQTTLSHSNEVFLKGWKTLSEGGSVSSEELQSYQSRIDELEKRTEIVCKERTTTAESLEGKQLEEATRILGIFKTEYALHAQDILLLESLNMKYNAVQSKVRAEFIASENSQKGIETALNDLEQLCQKDTKKTKGSLPQQILKVLDLLRRSIYTRAQYLTILQSKIELTTVNISEEPKEQPSLSPRTAISTANQADESDPKKKKDDPKKSDPGKKGAAPKGASQSQQQPQQAAGGKGAKAVEKKEPVKPVEKEKPVVVATVKDNVTAIISNAREEIMTLVSAYLQSKAKDSITRPNQIPPSVDEFMQRVDTNLQKHFVEADSHRKSCAQELRGQVVRLSTLLLRAPNVLFKDIMSLCLKGAADVRAVAESKYSSISSALEEQRIRHVMTLKPTYSHPQMRQHLDEVCRQEESRIDNALEAFHSHIRAVQDIESEWAAKFLEKMIFYSSTQLQLLDGMIFLEDLLPGEQPLATKRKSLKQLIRANELKQAAAASAASTSLANGTSAMSGPFPIRTWAGLPLGEFAALMNGIGADDALSTGQPATSNVANLSASKSKPPVGKESVKKAAGESGPQSRDDPSRSRQSPSQTTNDTPAHRAVVSLRDQVYTQFRSQFEAQQIAIRERQENGIQKEQRWRAEWRASIQNLRSLAAEPLAAPTQSLNPSHIPNSVSQAAISTAGYSAQAPSRLG